MNIFYLHHHQDICAQMHNDKHTVKMALEYAQILSTAHRFLDGTQSVGLSKTGRRQTKYVLSDDREHILYSATHINHPSSVWVRQSDKNYNWLFSLYKSLLNEYTYRYGKVHKCSELKSALAAVPSNIPKSVFTEPTPAMPDEYKVPNDSVQSYRNYYNGSKQRMAVWKNRPVPNWFNVELSHV